MSADTPSTTPQPGATYKFVVRTTEEAVQTIRERLGENAKVLSVRQLSGQGLGGLFSKPKLEVIAQVEPAAEKVAVSPRIEETEDVPQPANFAGVNSSFVDASVAARPSSLGSGVAAPRMPLQRDTLPRLAELLKRAGFSAGTMSRLESAGVLQEREDRPLHHALVEVGQALRRQAATRKPRPLPGRTAFLGTPGVGRTTALCKWLAREVFARQRVGRVLKAEFDRPNPAEGLAVFCEALGLTLEYYSPSEGQGPTTLGGPAGEFLYADLPGLSLRSPAENAELSKFLNREKFTGRVLVLNALYDASFLKRAYIAGADLGATHVVFTHLDELEHWGRLWDFLLEGELSPLFLATGPSLTGDCDEDAVNAVIRKTLPGA